MNRKEDAVADRPRWARHAVTLFSVGLVTAVALLLACRRGGGGEVKPAAAVEDGIPKDLFVNWPKPDLALLLSGEQHGYLLPCGCSSPQYGGLERRANLIARLQTRGWPVVGVDLGDLPQSHANTPAKLPNLQGLIKYRYSMDALRTMGYAAVGFGKYEMGLPLDKALGEYALNNPQPAVVAGNLSNAGDLFPGMTVPVLVHADKASGLRLGIASVVGPGVAKESKDPQVRFDAVEATLTASLKKLTAEKADLFVLLYQGSSAEAEELAGKFRHFQIILCLGDHAEPPGQPKIVGGTMVVQVGHKGRHVGVVGVRRKPDQPKTFQLFYQLVLLSPDFATPTGQEGTNPTARLMEQYTKELETSKYLDLFEQRKTPHPFQVQAAPGAMPTYLGSQSCKSCHEAAYEVWKKTPHAHAYDTLKKATNPSRRTFDAECVVCHTTGFAHLSGFSLLEKTPKLIDVGCESCHGPGSEHKKDPNNAKWYALMNPWRPVSADEKPEQKKARHLRVNDFCRGCHDDDNDVNWDFAKKWPKIDHPTPKE